MTEENGNEIVMIKYQEGPHTEIDIETKKFGKETLKFSEFVRWSALIKAVEVTGDFAERAGMDLDKTSDWIKPRHMQKFVDEKYNDIYHALYVELFGKARPV